MSQKPPTFSTTLARKYLGGKAAIKREWHAQVKICEKSLDSLKEAVVQMADLMGQLDHLMEIGADGEHVADVAQHLEESKIRASTCRETTARQVSIVTSMAPGDAQMVKTCTDLSRRLQEIALELS